MLDVDVSPAVIAILMLATLVVGIFSGFPLGFILAGTGFIFGILFMGDRVYGLLIAKSGHLLLNYILLAAPLFVFMGNMLGHSGVTEKLFGTMHIIMGGLRGGLAMATIFVATIFAACTGVIAASVTTMGILALPPMLKRGYDKALACGTVCAGGTLGILIPPSIMIVIYGPMAGISVGQLFAGAFVPGFILSGLYMAYIGIRCWLKPELGPSLPIEERRVLTTMQKITAMSTQLIPPLILILGVLGSIFAGIATPTEASGAGAFIATMLAIAYRRFNMTVLKDTLYGTLYITGFLMLLTVGAGVFTSVFTYLGGSEFATAVLTAVPGGKWGSFAVMMFIIFIFGMLIEWIGSIFIVVPLFTPIAAELGFDPVWFAIAVCVMYQTGFLSPPNAHAIFYLKGVAPPEVTVGDIIKGVWPFIGLIIIGLALITIFPRLVLWLPDLIIGIR
ncbi:MAG TPA: TRAP transporter large permease subunit [Dehalococcoidia bacterium]|nr:TRAP transporter large permease subunit [Dehalococcoidia bacterium]